MDIPYVYPTHGTYATAAFADPDFGRRHGATDCPLTKRELEVVIAIANGLGAKGAGESLGLSALTVKSHIVRIKDELCKIADREMIDVRDNAGMVFYCLHKRWIIWERVPDD